MEAMEKMENEKVRKMLEDDSKKNEMDALDKMERAKIRCWNRTHKKMKWKLALRIATSPNERWLFKAAEWNPELSSKYRTNASIGRIPQTN